MGRFVVVVKELKKGHIV